LTQQIQKESATEFVCNKCKKKGKCQESRYVCAKCKYVVHEKCLNKPYRIIFTSGSLPKRTIMEAATGLKCQES
jgi:transcription initiation factor TFIIIB Brf1 subunit/transcription initiation factor TFIIB